MQFNISTGENKNKELQDPLKDARNNIRRIVVKLWMLTEKKKLLLLRRLPGVNDACLWENPSRMIDAEDTAVKGITTELTEKAGISIEPKDLILYDSRVDGDKLIETFVCKMPEQAVCVMPDQVMDARYVPIDDIDKMRDELTDDAYNNFVLHRNVINDMK